MTRIGILGTGNIGRVHANQCRKIEGIELYAYDTNRKRLQSFVYQFEAIPCSTEDELIKKSDVIIICIPTDMHLGACHKAIAHGRQVLLEKPMARTVQQCIEIMDAATKADVLVNPGQVVRYFPEFELGHRIVQEGMIGDPAAVRTRRGGRMPQGADNWFMDFTRSGGVLLDLAIHDFDWLRWTFGEVKSLYAQALMGKVDYGDHALTSLSFDSGVIAFVETTWMDSGGFRASFEVLGSQGLIEFDSRQTGGLRVRVRDEQPSESLIGPKEDPYYKQLREFLEAIRQGVHTLVAPIDGLMAVSLSEAALESAETGKVVVPSRHF